MKFSVVVLCLVGCAAASVIPRDLDDAHLNTVEIAAKYGYPAETHEVQTDDGYILTLHRIPFGKKCGKENSKGPVLIQHGLFCSSADWVVMGPDHGLAFILADNCYDVWMGNSRGNRYSLGHTDPGISDDDYWNFSWHEMADSDLPRVIDQILRLSESEQLIYAGHSQGTTQFFIFNELHPEYESKIKGFLAMAPIAFMGHSDSFVLQLISHFQAELNWISQFIGMNQFMPSGGFISQVAETVCKDVYPGLEALCDNILFLACGFDADQLNTTALPVIFGHVPAGASTKQLLHYAQSLNSGKFRWFDHGVVKNEIIYGSIHPPEYQLDKVTVPTYLFWSDNDWLANPKDVEKLKEKLGNLVADHEIPYEKFNHLDYMWAIDVVDLLYKPMLEVMDKL